MGYEKPAPKTRFCENRMNAPKDLDTITDVVLRYRPPEKAKAAKKREKRKAKRCKERLTVLMYIIPKYITNHTYTGYGCCMCGKNEEIHKISEEYYKQWLTTTEKK